MNFPGSGGLGGAGIPGIPGRSSANVPAGYDPNDPNVKWLTNAMESCYAKTAMSGVAGFALGGLFGMFMASDDDDDETNRWPTPPSTHRAPPAHARRPGHPRLGVGVGDRHLVAAAAEAARARLQDMGARSWSTAKNFGAVGALFSGIECGIEGLRAKNDLGNGVAAGCLTGAILARNGGPQAAAVGCAGFAAFSAAIDAWMRMPKDED
ncbi:Mitochondrial import inner membrane translocase subunit tim22 [Staphylotrichum longicolle]|uniref:Mitochondrial import inner membrane translocase subunit TIM22 n=1 Tax=Staphylotrichum longicolle TaxID=669026 RepID=A0AAD4EXU6_9PEZI|nr:Mitochondrial import inner membrane translocase subunit tim22 [Staphylotrichum longicolle]